MSTTDSDRLDALFDLVERKMPDHHLKAKFIADCKQSIRNWNAQEATKAVVAELKKFEKFTHNGRGTILWEMDELATRLNDRIAQLTDEKGK